MKRLITAVCMTLALAALAAPARAQVQFGVQANYADDADLGLGARGQFGLGPGLADLLGVVSVDFFFPDCGLADCSYIEFNGNVLYPFAIEESNLSPYVGGGLNIAHASADYQGLSGSNTDLGLNALGGLNFGIGALAAFAEARIELSGGEQFVITFGILFGGGGGE